MENREEEFQNKKLQVNCKKHKQSTSVHMTDSLHCAQDFTKLTPKSYKLKIQIKTFWDSCDASLLKKSPDIVNKSLGSHLLSRQTRAGRDEASEAERGRWRFRGTTEKGFSEIEKSDAWRQRRKWLCAKSKRWSTLFADVCSCCASLHVPACQHSIICEKNWMVLESGPLMESATVSLLGHCLQMSHPADKNPLCRATPSLSVTRMKYEYSISVEIFPMISTKSSIWTAQLATMTGSTFCEAGRGTLRTHAVSWSTNAADPFANTKYICDKTILADCIDPPEHQPSSLGLTNCCGADQHYLMTVMYSKINKLMKWKLRMWPWIIRAEEQPSVRETWQHRFLFIYTRCSGRGFWITQYCTSQCSAPTLHPHLHFLLSSCIWWGQSLCKCSCTETSNSSYNSTLRWEQCGPVVIQVTL